VDSLFWLAPSLPKLFPRCFLLQLRKPLFLCLYFKNQQVNHPRINTQYASALPITLSLALIGCYLGRKGGFCVFRCRSVFLWYVFQLGVGGHIYLKEVMFITFMAWNVPIITIIAKFDSLAFCHFCWGHPVDFSGDEKMRRL